MLGTIDSISFKLNNSNCIQKKKPRKTYRGLVSRVIFKDLTTHTQMYTEKRARAHTKEEYQCK